MRRPIVLLAIVAVFALVLAACGGDDPTPTAAPAAAAPAAAAPAAAAPAAPAAAPGSDIPEVNFRVLAQQSSYAPFIEGWREMISRGTNGRITFTPQDATEQEAVDFINRNMHTYDTTIFRLNEDHVPLWNVAAAKGLTPTEAADPVTNLNFTGGQVIDPQPQNLWMSFPAACMNFYTLDPEIKTIADFEGKRIHMGSPGNTVLPVARILTRAAGLEGKFTEIIGGAKSNFESLGDREVDVAGSGIIFAGHPLGSSTSAGNQLAQLTGSFFNVGMPLSLIEKAQAENPDWTEQGLLPAVKLNVGDLSRAAKVDYDMIRSDNEYCVGSITVNFQTSPGADQDALYHIGRSMAENLDVADDYFPFVSTVWKERLAHTWNPQSSFAPGIRRAWDEAGITYGIEGIREWEKGFDREAYAKAWDAAN